MNSCASTDPLGIVFDNTCADLLQTLLFELEDVFKYDTTSIVHSIPSSALSTNGIDIDSSKKQRLVNFLGGMPSATSRADMIGLLRSQLISHFAKEAGCDSVLYGDTTTRLAERTLSETAKGRGGAIPWLTADGDCPLGVKIAYPMRDLLRKEITAYTNMTTPPLTLFSMENPPNVNLSASSKNSTIEHLMGQYFESAEQHYPSIVANVVRTSGRLVASSSESEIRRPCQMCRLPIAEGEQGLHWSGEQGGPESSTFRGSDQDSAELCYGCARSMLNP
ncbi:MAG: hypothetical protein Q9186_003424 [Xanthomendoza sp. 1 TL-2023]